MGIKRCQLATTLFLYDVSYKSDLSLHGISSGKISLPKSELILSLFT